MEPSAEFWDLAGPAIPPGTETGNAMAHSMLEEAVRRRARGDCSPVAVGGLLDWGQGQAEVLRQLYSARVLAAGLREWNLAAFLDELRRVVASWDAETYQMAADLARGDRGRVG